MCVKNQMSAKLMKIRGKGLRAALVKDSELWIKIEMAGWFCIFILRFVILWPEVV